MDLGTILGLVLGFGLIGGAMMLGGGIMPFIDAQSALIVIGGTIAATTVNQRLPVVIGAIKVGMQAFFDRSSPKAELVPLSIDLAAKARKEGLVALFKPGSDSLLPVSFVFLDEVIRITEEFPYELSIEGHADDKPISTPEKSNVDLAQQFVNLIVSQRAFQANTRTVSVTNELMANLVSLGQ